MNNNLDLIHEFADLGDVILHYVLSEKVRPWSCCTDGRKPGGSGDM